MCEYLQPFPSVIRTLSVISELVDLVSSVTSVICIYSSLLVTEFGAYGNSVRHTFIRYLEASMKLVL